MACQLTAAQPNGFTMHCRHGKRKTVPFPKTGRVQYLLVFQMVSGVMGVTITLDLSQHCIQTELKRLYNKSINSYFKAAPADKPELEQLIEGLRRALETVDFGKLRTAYPALAGGMDPSAGLCVADGRLTVTIGKDVISF